MLRPFAVVANIVNQLQLLISAITDMFRLKRGDVLATYGRHNRAFAWVLPRRQALVVWLQ
jgi:hypothetical protein